MSTDEYQSKRKQIFFFYWNRVVVRKIIYNQMYSNQIRNNQIFNTKEKMS